MFTQFSLKIIFCSINHRNIYQDNVSHQFIPLYNAKQFHTQTIIYFATKSHLFYKKNKKKWTGCLFLPATTTKYFINISVLNYNLSNKTIFKNSFQCKQFILFLRTQKWLYLVGPNSFSRPLVSQNVGNIQSKQNCRFETHQSSWRFFIFFPAEIDCVD